MLDPSLFSPTYDLALCDALAGAGHDVTLHSRAPRPLEPDMRGRHHSDPHFYRVAERLRAKGGLVAQLAGPTKVVEHAADFVRLTAALRRDPPDVVHVQWFVVPLVVTVHNTRPMHGKARSRVQTAGWHRTQQLADHLIVHTEPARRAMVDNGFDEGRITVVPLGLLPSIGFGQSTAVSPAEGEIEVLLFGKLRPYKGADLLIEAMGRLAPSARARTKVRIVGEALMAVDELRTRAAELGIADRIEWDLRFVPEEDVAAVLDRADVIVFPYREIDASAVLMTALGHGKPVIAADVGALGEVIVDDVSGLLVPASDVHALAEALARLVEDEPLRRRLGAGAAARADALASWEEIAEMTAAVYHHAAEAWSRERPS